MIKTFCKWYLKMWLRLHNWTDLEFVISCDGYRLRKRDFKYEEMIKHALKKIK